MGGFKNWDVERSEPRNPTTLADLAAENMGVSAGATGATTMRRWQPHH